MLCGVGHTLLGSRWWLEVRCPVTRGSSARAEANGRRCGPPGPAEEGLCEAGFGDRNQSERVRKVSWSPYTWPGGGPREQGREMFTSPRTSVGWGHVEKVAAQWSDAAATKDAEMTVNANQSPARACQALCTPRPCQATPREPVLSTTALCSALCPGCLQGCVFWAGSRCPEQVLQGVQGAGGGMGGGDVGAPQPRLQHSSEVGLDGFRQSKTQHPQASCEDVARTASQGPGSGDSSFWNFKGRLFAPQVSGEKEDPALGRSRGCRAAGEGSRAGLGAQQQLQP